jgi:hypothetical protein
MIGSKSIQQSDFAITDFLDTFTFGENGSQFIPKENSVLLGQDISDNSETNVARSMTGLKSDDLDRGAASLLTDGTQFGSWYGGSNLVYQNSNTATKAWWGVDFGADGVAITKAILYGNQSSDGSTAGFTSTSISDVTFTLFGSDSAQATNNNDLSGLTTVGSVVVSNTQTKGVTATISASSNTTKFRYYYVQMNTTESTRRLVGEIELFTVGNSFSTTSMSAANQSTNTPSLTFPLLNPLSAAFSTTLSNGNTTFSGSTGNGDDVNPGIIIPKTGKWVWQVTNTTDADLIYGMRNFSDMKAGDYSYTNLYGFYSHTGNLVQGASPSGSYLDAASGNDVYQFYYDADTRKMWVSDNGTIPNSGNPDGGSNEMFTIPDSGFDLCPTALVGGTSPNSTFDFGLNGVSLHANGGTFLPLTSANLPTPDAQGVDHFQAKLYTGSNASQNVTGFDFNPAFLWIKNRNVSGESHHLMDTVRGDNKFIHSNSSAIERTGSLNNGSNALAFITDGFSITNASGSADELNLDTRTYVSWAWLGSNSTSTNTNGSLNTTVTAANAGHFSIVGWTMSDPAGAKTLGHGLSAAPELIIVKNRTDAGTNWPVYSEAVGNTKYMYLSTTAAAATFNMWQNTSPTSTVFYVSSNNEASGSANDEMIAYCFRSVPGVCKVGTYTGNGSADGPYIDLGFKPAFFMAKQSSAVENWVMLDNQRPNYNPTGGYLFANLNNAEGGLGSEYVDFLSSGVKLRTTGASVNGSATFIYLAMADIAGGGTLPPVYGN